MSGCRHGRFPLAPAVSPDRERLREDDAAVEDVRAIAVALGLGGHARHYPAHDVVQREVLPAIAALLSERDELARNVAAARDLCDCQDARRIAPGFPSKVDTDDIRRGLGGPPT